MRKSISFVLGEKNQRLVFSINFWGKTYLVFNRSQIVPFPEPGPPITKMMIGLDDFVDVDDGAIINDVINLLLSTLLLLSVVNGKKFASINKIIVMIIMSENEIFAELILI